MVDYSDLKASLYVPANHPKLISGLFESSGINAPSFILCTEDSLAEVELPGALRQVYDLLPKLSNRNTTTPIFLRPRNVDVLREFLTMKGIENVSGFVIPKADVDTLPAYLETLVGLSYPLMPVLETRSIFDEQGRVELREYLNRSPLGPSILALRIGGNDLLRLLGLKRMAGISIYETPLSILIAQLVMCFRPHGYRLTGVVCDSLNDPELLRAEARRDACMGLIGKTAIHPRQLPIITKEFSVSQDEIRIAREILRDSTRSVLAHNEMMLERIVHRDWAHQTLQRAGINSDSNELN